MICTTRSAVRAQRNKKFLFCSPCYGIVVAENLWKQFGLTKQPERNIGLVPTDLADRAKQFIALTQRGHTFAEIAEMWGVSKDKLSTAMHRCRRNGHEVPYLNHPGRVTKEYQPKPKAELRPQKKYRRNEHGGGRYGVFQCTAGEDGGVCAPCKAVRKKSRKQSEARAKQQGKVK